ncbi:MAG: DUF2914 domain-containing protein [Desulfobacterales bacterium]|nr:DUF2914 domain-containing protein [Desulfobacterales bacterium]MBF0396962.1 DUF2914 domain-containing protein [Desulfobacterales bacterium]
MRYIIFIFCLFLLVKPLFSEESGKQLKNINLSYATICEDVKDNNPKNPAVIFSISGGEVFCFSNFDSVSEKTVIYHIWYRNDKMSTKIKLTLQPPAWATFSSIQLREGDKGPWRVEIIDSENNLLQVLRFSITD